MRYRARIECANCVLRPRIAPLRRHRKITVKCPSVQDLLELEERCAAAGLNTYLIRDAGHTEIEPGSRTVLAVGPAPASAMDPLTRHLKPY